MMRRILKTVSPFTVFSPFLFALIFAVFLPPTAQALGRKEYDPKTMDGTDIWKSEFDVSGLKKGTYNFIVRATDAAGNVGVGGPFNVKVDPMAGLPETRIIFPEQGMIIKGDFTIVGVATARYGLKQVLLKINDGEYKVVEDGREYWSVKIPAEEFPDGKYTIYAKGIDTNDIAGPEVKIDFTMDAIAPVIEVTNHEIGDYISGNVKITGRVFDANGISSLEISEDFGETYKPLKHSSKRGEIGRHFQFTMKTKQGKKTLIDDGQVFYFIRATNGVGGADTRPFLFFVNNDPPKIEILTPGKEEDVFGDVQISGHVISAVGLKEFYYEWAGKRETIPLLQGNPFWSVQFFISRGEDRMRFPFRVTAVDRAGNSTTVTQRLNDRRRFGTPTVIIDHPPMPRGTGRMELAHDQPIYGHVEPWGYFPDFIFNTGLLNAPAKPSFRIDPEQISADENSLPIYAQAEDDTAGAAVIVNYNKAPPPPGFVMTYTELTIDSPIEYGEEDENENYMISWVGESVMVRGSIDNYSQGQTLEYRLRWDDSWKPIEVNSRGRFDTEISLAGLPQGPVPMELRTVRGGRGDYPVFLPVNKYTTMPTVRFLTPHERYGPVHRSMTTSGIIENYVPLDEVSYSYDGIEYEPLQFISKEGRTFFFGLFDYTAMHYNEETLRIRMVDRAGNVEEISPDVPYDDSGDFPEIFLNSPREGELVTGDFKISGLAKAPVDIDAVYWRIRTPNNPWDAVETTLSRRGGGEYKRMATTQTYDLTLTLDDVRDGENILEIFAEDCFGLSGEVTQRVFKVSTTAPEAVFLEPEKDQWNRGNVTVKGTVFDLNGIESLEVSLDYGLSYQKADFESRQTEASPWSITINTRAYADGVHSILARARDAYGIIAYSGSVINIDNTPPVIDLSSPSDGDKIGKFLNVTGQIIDNLELLSVYLEIVNIENPEITMSFNNLSAEENVIIELIDVSDLDDGDYSVRISAFDRALNETAVIRNITIQKDRGASEVAFYNPMPGIEHNGPLVVTGRVTGAVIPEEVTILLNNRRFDTAKVDPRYGIFRYPLPSEGINLDNPLVFSAAFIAPDGQRIASYDHTVKLNSFGPAIEVDSHNDGDVITKRPYIKGTAFLIRTIEEEHMPKSKVTSSVTKVELSLDNGRTFKKADGTNNWQYRLESALLPAGVLPVIIKATFIDGRVAYRRILLTVDVQPPVVKVLGPTENSAFRDKIEVYGSAKDNFDVDSVEVILRSGNKFLYQVPGFIQGLYFDANILGGVQYATGFGLTFFDDNVKVQAVAARGADNSRYSNWAFGGKVLANIYKTKLDRWFGPDWEFWTTSFTLGAQFLYFLMEEDENRVWMGQFLGQWEIIKADMSYFYPNWKYFKSYSLYMDHGIWFAPSDINSQQAWRTKYTICFGIRISLF